MIERQSELLDHRLQVCKSRWSVNGLGHDFLQILNMVVIFIGVVAPLLLTGSLGGAAIGYDPLKEFLSTDTGQWVAFVLALVSAIFSGLQARQKLPEIIERRGRKEQPYTILIQDIERFKTLPHNEEAFRMFLDRIDERMTFIERDQIEQAQEEIETQKILDSFWCEIEERATVGIGWPSASVMVRCELTEPPMFGLWYPGLL